MCRELWDEKGCGGSSDSPVECMGTLRSLDRLLQ